ncbi:putative ribonuclease H-like domain-containing protein [Tanacetum coccineum]
MNVFNPFGRDWIHFHSSANWRSVDSISVDRGESQQKQMNEQQDLLSSVGSTTTSRWNAISRDYNSRDHYQQRYCQLITPSAESNARGSLTAEIIRQQDPLQQKHLTNKENQGLKCGFSSTLVDIFRNVCKNNSVRVKKCFVCGSKLHLIKDCDFYNCVDSVPCKSKAASVSAGSRKSPASVPAGRSDSAASRNRPAVHSAGAPNHAGWSKRPATVSAGRPGSAGWLNPAARPYFRPSSVYFNTPTNLYDPMFMDKGRWDTAGDPSTDNDIGIVDSGCSRSMTGNKEKLADFVPIKGGIVKFGGGDGRISGKGTIRTSKLDFENVYYVEELQHFNLFSVSQICDKKNKVLFTDTDCLVLSEEFQLPDASQVVLRIPRKHDLYTFHISHLQPEQKVTCLVAKASLDESTRWHRRMAHVNFKTINKLAKEGLVDGLPLKVFSNEHNCVACNKGKQHKASYKHISAVRFITDTLQLLHMDLFGPTNIRSIDQKYYSLVVTDDFSRFSWTFFLGTKDETFYVLKEFITLIENQLNKKVKGIRCDNGTEFKNAKLIELCGEKGIKRDYSNPRTPQQNGVAERKNRTLIEAARTMLADSKLPTMFWTEAVSTACYVLNRVSITNPHNKTPYELISGKVPQISHLKPFGCQVTILNTSDYLGKFEGKADDGYLVGYASNSKAYRVYNLPNKRVEETLNLRFLEDKPNVQGIGHEWYTNITLIVTALVEEEAIKVSEIKTLDNDVEDEPLERNEIINIKESKSHPLENVIGFAFVQRSEDPKTSHLEVVKRIFRYIKGTTHLRLWYPKGSSIEAVVYADYDHFLKKQTALAISTTESEYVSAGKAYQQALWMKQAAHHYDILLDRLCHLTILSLDQHAHTLHHLESLLTISLDRLDYILKEDALVYQSLRNLRQDACGNESDFSCNGIPLHRINLPVYVESRKSPTAELFEVDSGRISIRHCEY